MAMLDDSHLPLPQPRDDHNTYHLGEIGHHNIVIACLPAGVYGITSAAIVAKQMLLSFSSIDFGLMVGIGGGAPSETADIRLGDVVVSIPTDRYPGVVQYDYGKTLANGFFYQTGTLNKPAEALLTAIANLRARHRIGHSTMAMLMESAAKSSHGTHAMFTYPDTLQDVLFEPSYTHKSDRPSCETCEPASRVQRPSRESTMPVVYYGLIASANQVMKDAITRDKLSNQLDVLCFEMEAAGLMDRFPCLVIRGICDYSDSHKNKQWQDYAAGTAAAYARELLEFSVPQRMPTRPNTTKQSVWSKLPISTMAFLGRIKEMEELQQCFDNTELGRRVAVIWGLSGYGKTQLALQYVQRHKGKYTSVLWIDSSCPAMVEQSLEQVLVQLGGVAVGGQSAAALVTKWLEREAPWHSAVEFRQSLRSFLHELLQSSTDTTALNCCKYNAHEDIIMPMTRFLQSQGADLKFNSKTTRITMGSGPDRKRVSAL